MNAIKIFTVALFLLVVSNLYSQTGEAKSLEIGNKWFYKRIIMYEDTLNYYQEVIGDTAIQNKQYAVILDNRKDTLYWFQRADSSKIFSFNTNVMEEYVVVDFSTPDTAWTFYMIKNDTIFFWDYWRARQCHYTGGGIGEYAYCYIKGIGKSEWSYFGHSPEEYEELIAGIIEGEFYGDSTVLSIDRLSEENIRGFSLYHNFPNPFNPSTMIRYEIPGQARNDNMLVVLKIYDVLGNEIATLVNEEKPAGVYEVEFTAAQNSILSSGIYFYQLKTGSFIETKKMLMLK